MDRDAVERAGLVLDVYASELSGRYHDLRAQMIGSTATNGLQLESMQAANAAEQANLDLIKMSLDTLPKEASVKDKYDEDVQQGDIAVPDAYTARQVQGSVLWVKAPSYNYKTTPFYIVGEGKPEPRRRGLLRHEEGLKPILLYPATERGGGVREATVWASEFDAALQRVQKDMGTDFTDEELEAMFDPDRERNGKQGVLVVGPETSPSLTATREVTGSGNPRKVPGRPRPIEQGRDIQIAWGEKHGKRVGDEIMSKYNVLDSLIRLTTAFGTKYSLRQALEEYKSKVPQDPVQALIASQSAPIK